MKRAAPTAAADWIVLLGHQLAPETDEGVGLARLAKRQRRGAAEPLAARSRRRACGHRRLALAQEARPERPQPGADVGERAAQTAPRATARGGSNSSTAATIGPRPPTSVPLSSQPTMPPPLALVLGLASRRGARQRGARSLRTPGTGRRRRAMRQADQGSPSVTSRSASHTPNPPRRNGTSHMPTPKSVLHAADRCLREFAAAGREQAEEDENRQEHQDAPGDFTAQELAQRRTGLALFRAAARTFPSCHNNQCKCSLWQRVYHEFVVNVILASGFCRISERNSTRCISAGLGRTGSAVRVCRSTLEPDRHISSRPSVRRQAKAERRERMPTVGLGS